MPFKKKKLDFLKYPCSFSASNIHYVEYKCSYTNISLHTLFFFYLFERCSTKIHHFSGKNNILSCKWHSLKVIWMQLYTKQAKSVTHFMFTHFKTRLNINKVFKTTCAHESKDSANLLCPFNTQQEFTRSWIKRKTFCTTPVEF